MAISLSRRRWIVGIVIVLLIGTGALVTASLRNDDSDLRVLIRYAARRMGGSQPSTTAEVVERMLRYEKRGRLNEALKLGVAWTDKYPQDFSSSYIYVNIAFIHLEEARRDRNKANEKIEQAISDRDKALACAPEALNIWADAARISEFAGDYSESQRCIQYGNAIKLLNQTSIRMQTEQPPNGVLTQDKRNEIEGKLRRKISAVQQKLREATCQERTGPPSH